MLQIAHITADMVPGLAAVGAILFAAGGFAGAGLALRWAGRREHGERR